MSPPPTLTQFFHSLYFFLPIPDPPPIFAPVRHFPSRLGRGGLFVRRPLVRFTRKTSIPSLFLHPLRKKNLNPFFFSPPHTPFTSTFSAHGFLLSLWGVFYLRLEFSMALPSASFRALPLLPRFFFFFKVLWWTRVLSLCPDSCPDLAGSCFFSILSPFRLSFYSCLGCA